jgi:hypothetical protein
MYYSLTYPLTDLPVLCPMYTTSPPPSRIPPPTPTLTLDPTLPHGYAYTYTYPYHIISYHTQVRQPPGNAIPDPQAARPARFGRAVLQRGVRAHVPVCEERGAEESR